MTLLCPKVNKLDSLLPDTPPLLMGAGPVPVPQEVFLAQRHLINHLGDSMNSVLSGIQEMGRYIFQTTSTRVFGISGPASAGMEMAVANLVGPGTKVLVLNLGTFSHRFAEMILGLGGEVKEITPANFGAFEVEEVRAEMRREHYDLLTLVHGETSCGMKNIYLKEIAQLAHDKNVLTIVDGVTTLSTMPFFMDEWKIDVAFTAGQKGLSAIPGISLVAFSERAFNQIRNRKTPQTHWCLDALRANRFWNEHEYHYTAPVTNLMALYEAMRLICVETLERRFRRHESLSLHLQRSLEIMGLQLYAPCAFRLNSVLAVKNLPGVSVKELLKLMRIQFGVEISGAFGLDIFRIGQMGEQCRPQNLKKVIEALGQSLEIFGKYLDYKSSLSYLDENFKNQTTENSIL
jgi:aspartate aminotransferase-like enzyme